MKTTLDPLTNLHRDQDLTPAWPNGEHPAAGLPEDKPGRRCDRWGHPCPGCGKATFLPVPPPTFIEPSTGN